MITATDTNILLAILVPNEDFYEASANVLEDAASEGSLVVSGIVYAELCFHFESQRDSDTFLESNEIRVQPLTREGHFLASRTWRTYRQRRKAEQNPRGFSHWRSRPRKQATRLLSRDRGFYRKRFPSLELHAAAEANAED